MNEVLRHNPESYEPKRQNLINFTNSKHDMVNFTKPKETDQLIKIFQDLAPDGLTRTQFAKFATAKDPGIGVGPKAAGFRMSHPCYTEYGISSFEQLGRAQAPNYNPKHQQAISQNT